MIGVCSPPTGAAGTGVRRVPCSTIRTVSTAHSVPPVLQILYHQYRTFCAISTAYSVPSVLHILYHQYRIFCTISTAHSVPPA
eukprot:137462-Rhodomonas_salina.2